ncbi:MAG: PQQ-binding-like beta-propeller repeat protein [Acidobacteriota bacterium]
MYRTPLSRITIFIAIFTATMVLTIFGQAKPTAEVDVTKCWAYDLNKESGEALASEGIRVFLGLDNGKVETLSFDGKRLWTAELGGDIRSNILAFESGLFLVTSTVSQSDANKPGGGILRGLSKETGITNWATKLPEAEKYFLGGFNGALIVVTQSGVIQSVDPKNGAVNWKREIADGFVAAPAFDGWAVIVATRQKQIFAVSLVSGEIISMRKVPLGVTALGETAAGEIIAGDERGNVTSLVNGTEKPYWKFKSGGEISAIFPVGDHLLVTSHDNFVYFLFKRNGGVMWKKRLTGRVSHVGLYMDRFALITSSEQHGAVLTDLTNGKVAGRMAFGDDESLVYSPVISNGSIFALTDKAVYAFSINGCPTNREGGPGN